MTCTCIALLYLPQSIQSLLNINLKRSRSNYSFYKIPFFLIWMWNQNFQSNKSEHLTSRYKASSSFTSRKRNNSCKYELCMPWLVLKTNFQFLGKKETITATSLNISKKSFISMEEKKSKQALFLRKVYVFTAMSVLFMTAGIMAFH